VATNTDQIITQLVADTKKFDGAMNGSIQVLKRFNKAGEEIGSRVRVVTRHMTDASKETDGFRVTMTRLSRDIKVAGTIFNTLEAGIKKAYSAASEGAKIMAAEQFFKNAGKSIAEYRKATNGMVSDAELMKKANLADSMGIDEKTFKKLVMVAEASALKTGQSFDYMFNSIIVGTARSSRLLLDNLGIIVSVGQANESYAKSIGKTVEQLTDQEKQLAFVAEVARKSQGTLDEYAKTTDRTAESFARFDASVDNLANTIKVSLAKAFADLMPSLTSFVQELITAIERGQWADVGRSIGLRIIQGLSSAFAKVDPQGLGGTSFFTKVSEAAGKQIDLNNYVTRMDIQAEKTNNLLGLTLAQKEIEKMTSESLPTLIRRFDTMKTTGSEALDNAISDLLKYNKALEDYLDLAKLFSSRPIKPVEMPSKSGGGRGAAIDSFLRKTERNEAGDRVTEIEDEEEAAAKERETGLKAAEYASDQYNKMASLVESGPKFAAPFNSGVVQFGRNAEQFNDYLKDNAKRQKEIFDDWLLRFGQVMGSSVEQIMTGQGLAKPLATIATGGDLAGGVMDMLGSALSGTTLAPMLATVGAPGGPLGMAIGAIVGVLLDLVDSLKPVMDLIGGILSGITQLIGNALLEFLTPLSMLAGPLNDLLAAIGLVVGSALRPFVAIFTVVVGVVSVVVQAFTFLITVLSPFVEAFVWIISMILSSGLQLFPLFMDLADTTKAITDAMNTAIGVMLSAAIGLNNAIVNFMRNTLKIKGFGKYLKPSDFKGPADEDENKDALNENTKALKDFTREFRNLPQSYKGGGTIYAAQDRERSRVIPGMTHRYNIGIDPVISANAGMRWRS
jgi:hypothetical protein